MSISILQKLCRATRVPLFNYLVTQQRLLSISRPCYAQAEREENSENKKTSLVHVDDHFQSIPEEKRDKASFLAAIEFFKKKAKNDRGHVEFIHSAMKHMKEYGLHKDLDVYKALLKVFPEGPLLPTNVWQKMFLHYPHQQSCCVRLLDEMEWNMVYPDLEIFDIVKARFGAWSFTTKKVRRMLYWYPRLRYTNKYLDRQLQDSRHADLTFVKRANFALRMMSRDKGSEITYTKVADDKSLVISSQSPLQRRLINDFDPAKTCYYVDGPFLVYVAEHPIKFVTFTTDPGTDSERLLDRFIDHEEIEDLESKPLYTGPLEEPKENGTVHEQIDQTILALGIFEKINENSASAWVNHLQSQNEPLKKSTVILRVGEADQYTD
ncbi:Evolutionarily conserved signaling intermediate in Toll pathway, mitochondrial [Aphelenchoides bicaudatus]|nr:Evolutionarily conserved signaling intermediate in Toll pathway, mitochondrial [Aphelenchoides bicaudatus]